MAARRIEFNPRTLVPAVANGRHAVPHNGVGQSRLDAIFISTRNRPDFLYDLLHELQVSAAPVFILVSEPADVPADIGQLCRDITVLTPDDHQFQRQTPVLQASTALNVVCTPPRWDLPTKRNYALWFARTHGFTKILMVDDDIRGFSPCLLSAGARALDAFSAAGPYVEDFPDLSLAGHAERLAGDTVYTFLSGSCLFVNAPAVRAFFPPIYNEDWLFLLPHVLDQAVANIGIVGQLPYDPFNITNARFQEFGEVIADGLYWLLCEGKYSQRSAVRTWRAILDARRTRLATLRESAPSEQQRAALLAALEVSYAICPSRCIDFLLAWESAIQGFRPHE